MSTIRLVTTGTTDDYEGYAAFTKRASAFVEHQEPGTLVWECFADDRTGAVLWHEVYIDTDAYLTHLRNMEEQGFFGELVRMTRNIHVSSLEPLTDDRAWDELNKFHADFLGSLARLSR